VAILGDAAALAAWRSARLVVAEDQVRLLAPVPRPGKLIMVGSNYKSHVGEASATASNLPPARSEKHDWPAAFSKFPSVVVGPDEPIPYPSHTRQLDYEAELCVVIGKRCRAISEADADAMIAGYTIGNDISLRDIQFAEMRRGLILLGRTPTRLRRSGRTWLRVTRFPIRKSCTSDAGLMAHCGRMTRPHT